MFCQFKSVLILIDLKLPGPIFWLLRGQIIFHTNQSSKKVMGFLLFTPAESVSFQSQKYSKQIKIIYVSEHKKLNKKKPNQTKKQKLKQMHHGNIQKIVLRLIGLIQLTHGLEFLKFVLLTIDHFYTGITKQENIINRCVSILNCLNVQVSCVSH